VQRQLADNAASRHIETNTKAPSLLTGLVRDATGDRLCPTYASKKGRRYRYYISKRLMHPNGSPTSGWRLPARELEAVVLQSVCGFLRDELRLLEALQVNDAPPDSLRSIIQHAASVADELTEGPVELQRQLLSGLLHRNTLDVNSMCLDIKRSSLTQLVAAPDASDAEGSFGLVVPVHLKRRGVEAKLVMTAAHGRSSRPDDKLIAVLAEALRWLDDLAQGRATSVRDIARRYNRDPGEVSRTLPLAFLAPGIVEAIVEGRQPVELTPRQLKRQALPCRWDDQYRRLGFRR
jgi:hypothetical protein